MFCSINGGGYLGYMKRRLSRPSVDLVLAGNRTPSPRSSSCTLVTILTELSLAPSLHCLLNVAVHWPALRHSIREVLDSNLGPEVG
jgi:hypothetical protein